MTQKLKNPVECPHEWWEPDPEFPRPEGELAVLKPQKRCRLCGAVVEYIPPKSSLLALGWKQCKD